MTSKWIAHTESIRVFPVRLQVSQTTEPRSNSIGNDRSGSPPLCHRAAVIGTSSSDGQQFSRGRSGRFEAICERRGRDGDC